MLGGPRSRWVHLVVTLLVAGGVIVVVAPAVLARPTGVESWLWLSIAVFWAGYSVHSWLQASTGTSLTRDGLRLRQGRHVTEVSWDDVVRLRPDLESRWASHLVAELRDGSEVRLPAVPLDARDAVLAWAPKSVQQ